MRCQTPPLPLVEVRQRQGRSKMATLGREGGRMGAVRLQVGVDLAGMMNLLSLALKPPDPPAKLDTVPSFSAQLNSTWGGENRAQC